MSFIDSIKSWLSGNKDTVNKTVDKGSEVVKDKAPEHEDKIETVREKFHEVFNEESEPMSPREVREPQEVEDESDFSEADSVATPAKESSVSEVSGEDSSKPEVVTNAAESGETSVEVPSGPGDNAEGLVEDEIVDVSANKDEEVVETLPEFDFEDNSPQKVDSDSSEDSIDLSDKQDLDFGTAVEPKLEEGEVADPASVQVEDGPEVASQENSDVASEDVDSHTEDAISPALSSAVDPLETTASEGNSVESSEEISDVVSEGVEPHTNVSTTSTLLTTDDSIETPASDDDLEDFDVISEDADVHTDEADSPLSIPVEDSLEAPVPNDDIKDNKLAEAPAPKAPLEAPVQVEEDVTSTVKEEDLIDPDNNVLTGFTEDADQGEEPAEGSDLVNTEVTDFSLDEPKEDFSLTDKPLTETVAEKVEDSDSSKTLGDLLEEDNQE